MFKPHTVARAGATRSQRRRAFALSAALSGLLGAAVVGPAYAQPAPDNRALGSLRGLAPLFPNDALDAFSDDRAAVLALGKAFFFDQAVGSDGMACASCHFSAGADGRIRNALNPGLLDKRFGDGDAKFGGSTGAVFGDFRSPAATAGKTAGGQVANANLTLQATDFPLHKLAKPNDRNSRIVYSTNDTVSSAGTRFGEFITAPPDGRPIDECARAGDPIFQSHNFDVRRVEPRNTPTVVNSAFFHRLFWDGRANNIFNGVGVFGRRETQNDPLRVLVFDGSSVSPEVVEIDNAPAASQSTGPTRSAFEMSCEGRTMADLGRKLMARRALRLQDVHAQDSVLGPRRHGSGKGLVATYEQLIQEAFKSKYWAGPGSFDGFRQIEHNFALFWGLAVATYEGSLVSDRSKFDRVMEGNGSFTASERLGHTVFLDKGKCVNCHDGPELSKAATHLIPEAQEGGLVERMPMGDGGVALYDNGFYNIGVTPTVADIGLGGTDPWDIPLSFTRQYIKRLLGNNTPDRFQVDPCTFEVPFFADGTVPGTDCSVEPTDPSVINGLRVAVDGAFKTPTLRNVGLTAPYFHNGSVATLKDVITFYNRGGNRRGANANDSTGTGPTGNGGSGGSNLDPDINSLGLTNAEQNGLVAFLLTMTDDRVSCSKAPFDGPELIVVNGHRIVDANSNGEADPNLVRIPPTGANGRPADGRPCLPNAGNLFHDSAQMLVNDTTAQGPLTNPSVQLRALLDLILLRREPTL